MASNNKQGNAKFMIVLVVGLIISIVIFFIGLFSILDKDNTDDTTYYETTTRMNSITTTESIPTTGVSVDAEGSTVIVTEPTQPVTQTPQEDQTESDQQGDSDTQGETSFKEYYESLSPNGVNNLSDNPDNEFIALISEKYDVNPELLVAIYSVPDTGTNYVIEFKDSRDDNGDIIKSPDTLRKLYYIDKNKNIEVATPSGIGNEGVSKDEGRLVIAMVTTMVMKQHSDYFTGV